MIVWQQLNRFAKQYLSLSALSTRFFYSSSAKQIQNSSINQEELLNQLLELDQQKRDSIYKIPNDHKSLLREKLDTHKFDPFESPHLNIDLTPESDDEEVVVDVENFDTVKYLKEIFSNPFNIKDKDFFPFYAISFTFIFITNQLFINFFWCKYVVDEKKLHQKVTQKKNSSSKSKQQGVLIDMPSSPLSFDYGKIEKDIQILKKSFKDAQRRIRNAPSSQ